MRELIEEYGEAMVMAVIGSCLIKWLLLGIGRM